MVSSDGTSQYENVAQELKDALCSLVPTLAVELKPIPSKHESHGPDSVRRARLGTFEVQLGWQVAVERGGRVTRGGLSQRVLWSKRVRGKWPQVWPLAEAIMLHLASTPTVKDRQEMRK